MTFEDNRGMKLTEGNHRTEETIKKLVFVTVSVYLGIHHSEHKSESVDIDLCTL